MTASTAQPKPSELVKASPFLMKCYEYGVPLAEVERNARDSVRLKEAYCSNPCHARKAARDPDYWPKFLMSGINVYSVPD